MQRNKNTNKSSELENIIANSEKLTSSLTDVIKDFNVKRSIQIFDMLKCKGIAISSLLSILLILPFYAVANINQLMKCNISNKDIQAKKTTLYDTKNNEYINWRKLLLLHAKRFIYLVNNNIYIKSENIKALIFDDTLIEKTGKKIERVGFVHDHVTGRFVLGFKLLVCGFWDGSSFIPLDFSLHREKGSKHKIFINSYHKESKQLECLKIEFNKLEKNIAEIAQNLVVFTTKQANKPNKINEFRIERTSIKLSLKKEQIENIKRDIEKASNLKQESYKKLKRYYSKENLYGLNSKEREEQFKKAVSTKSSGFVRRKESDKSKIDSMLLMLGRVVKAGLVPDYVIVDSWFFCFELLEKLSNIKKGAIKLVSRVKINNQKFIDCSKGKEFSVKTILKVNTSNVQRCKKFKAQYIKVKCTYKGKRVNLFYVKQGRSEKWHLILTTDLNLSFIKLFEIYHIRWSIEVFFKESKQYLHLSDCRSNIFDAQIADITIAMMQSIMLSYFKRINYQQSIGGLFIKLSNELVELDLVNRLLSLFLELLEAFCLVAGIDFIEFQKDIMRSDYLQEKILQLFPKKLTAKRA